MARPSKTVIYPAVTPLPPGIAEVDGFDGHTARDVYVSAAKNAAEEVTKKSEAPKKDPETAKAGSADDGGSGKQATAPGRKSLGPKEPPPFIWKLIGHAGGVAVTLFKAVEREDIDSQFERLRKEGYYTGLRIADIDEKVVQPNPPKVPKKSLKRIVKSAKPASKPARPTAKAFPKKATRKASSGAATATAKAKKPASRAAKKTPSAKAASKPAKTATAKKTPKRAIKKKK